MNNARPKLTMLTEERIHEPRDGIAPFVGDTLDSKATSPLTFIYCNEIIDQAERLSSSFQLGEASIDLSEIEKIGPEL